MLEAVENLLDSDRKSLVDETRLHFQENGAPPHYVLLYGYTINWRIDGHREERLMNR